MSEVRIIGSHVPNMPWQERPEGAKKWMPVWRYNKNPIIERNTLEGVARIFNSAVIPYENKFMGVFRGENRQWSSIYISGTQQRWDFLGV